MSEINEAQLQVIKTLYLDRSDKNIKGEDDGLTLPKTLEILIETGKNVTLDELKELSGLFHSEDKRKIYLNELLHYYNVLN